MVNIREKEKETRNRKCYIGITTVMRRRAKKCEECIYILINK
jgi:hypothetical protein